MTSESQAVMEPELSENEIVSQVNENYLEKQGFSDIENYLFEAEKGLNEEVIRAMSKMKDEPQWMLDIRLEAYSHFKARPMPTWGADLSGIDFENIYYYIKPSERQEDDWSDVPEYIKNTFEKDTAKTADESFIEIYKRLRDGDWLPWPYKPL